MASHPSLPHRHAHGTAFPTAPGAPPTLPTAARLDSQDRHSRRPAPTDWLPNGMAAAAGASSAVAASSPHRQQRTGSGRVVVDRSVRRGVHERVMDLQMLEKDNFEAAAMRASELGTDRSRKPVPGTFSVPPGAKTESAAVRGDADCRTSTCRIGTNAINLHGPIPRTEWQDAFSLSLICAQTNSSSR